MVDGVPGYMDHVLRHVVVEHEHQPEDVIILHLPVEETIVLVQIAAKLHATTNVVLIRISKLLSLNVVVLNSRDRHENVWLPKYTP